MNGKIIERAGGEEVIITGDELLMGSGSEDAERLFQSADGLFPTGGLAVSNLLIGCFQPADWLSEACSSPSGN